MVRTRKQYELALQSAARMEQQINARNSEVEHIQRALDALKADIKQYEDLQNQPIDSGWSGSDST